MGQRLPTSMADSDRTLWLIVFPWSDDVATMWNDAPADVRVFRSIDGTLGRAYISGVNAPATLPDGATLSRIERILDVKGASAGSDAPYHYVVSTDIVAEHEADMNAWYDTEHAPGLAAVPGTVHAQRHIDRDAAASPRYHASYDLATQAAYNSEPWLAVRATDWSSRVRPAFRNTQRIMYERVR